MMTSMKKPDIARRMLPLMDIIFLLLAFFIILPHGIVTNEKIQIESLQDKSEHLKREVNYYQWKYGDLKVEGGKIYKTMTLNVTSNELYLDSDRVPKELWEAELRQKIEASKINFVFLKISDIPGKLTSVQNIEFLQKILSDLEVIHIVETDG